MLSVIYYVSYFKIYNYCLLEHVLPKELWKGLFVLNDIPNYIISDKSNVHVCLLFIVYVHYQGTSKSNTLPFNNSGTSIMVLL